MRRVSGLVLRFLAGACRGADGRGVHAPKPGPFLLHYAARKRESIRTFPSTFRIAQDAGEHLLTLGLRCEELRKKGAVDARQNPRSARMNEPEHTFDPCEALTVKEVAELLHVSEPTVRKYMKSCELRTVLIGRCRRVMREDLEDFLELRRTDGWQSYRSGTARLEGRRHAVDDFADGDGDIPF